MTQEQRYDMITEMYEATRYAKEIHKKKEQAEKRMNIIDKAMTTTNKKNIDKFEKKKQDALNQYTSAVLRDSIGTDKEASFYKKRDMPESFDAEVDQGRKMAKRHPGRYEKHVERKPGTYLK